MIGHVTPEAYDGGTLALLKDGDVIVIDSTSLQRFTQCIFVTFSRMRRTHTEC